MRVMLAILTIVMLFTLGCDLVKDTKNETEEAGGAATGLAEKMSEGTLGEYDEDTDE